LINWSGQLRISSVVSKYRNTRWPLVLLVLLLGSSRSDCQQVQSDESDAKYDVVSIKRATDCKETRDGPRFGVTVSPERLRIDCQTAEFFIRQAFLTAGADMMKAPRQFLQPLKGLPGWVTADQYRLDAKATRPLARQRMLGPMLQAVLRERFHIKVHHEPYTVSGFELVMDDKRPLQLTPSQQICAVFDPDARVPGGTRVCGILIRSLNPAVPSALYGSSITDLCTALSVLLERPVTDGTHLNGTFDIKLELSKEALSPRMHEIMDAAEGPESAGGSVFSALAKLGLKLTPKRIVEHLLVIDHIERPSAN